VDANGGDVAGIVYHEITHGLACRLITNASGSCGLGPIQSGMMNEAWADYFSTDLLVAEGGLADTATPAELKLGNHVVPGGIRAKPTDCPVNPVGVGGCNGDFGAPVLGGYTYGDLAGTDNTSPHNGGEVWAETLWDLRNAVGRDAALKLIAGGMRLSPDDPSMLDARDAILRQALAMRSAPSAPDDYFATAWAVFQARGMGFDASTTGAASTTPAESYTAPRNKLSGEPMTITDAYPGGDNDGRTGFSWPLGAIGRRDKRRASHADRESSRGQTLNREPAVVIRDGASARNKARPRDSDQSAPHRNCARTS